MWAILNRTQAGQDRHDHCMSHIPSIYLTYATLMIKERIILHISSSTYLGTSIPQSPDWHSSASIYRHILHMRLLSFFLSFSPLFVSLFRIGLALVISFPFMSMQCGYLS